MSITPKIAVTGKVIHAKGVAIVTVVSLVVLLAAPQIALAYEVPLSSDRQTSICHASTSETNSYVVHTPAVSSSGYVDHGHDLHVGPV